MFTAARPAFDLAITMVRKGGLFVAVGIPPTSEGNIEINPMIFFSKGITMIYSGVGTVQDMRELVPLAADGKVKSHIGRQGPLSELPTSFDELEAGAYVGRGRHHRPGPDRRFPIDAPIAPGHRNSCAIPGCASTPGTLRGGALASTACRDG